MKKFLATFLAASLLLTVVSPSLAGPSVQKAVTQVTATKETGSQKLYIVKFKGPVQENWKKQLRDLDVTIGDYLPEFSFIIRMEPQSVAKVKALASVSSVDPYDSKKKLAPKLVAAITKLVKDQVSGKHVEQTAVKIETFDAAGVNSIKELVASMGGQVKSREGNSLTATLTIDKVTALAQDENILYLEQAETYRFFNDRAAGVIGADEVRPSGLDGTGQVVAVADTGLDRGVNDNTMHPDFQGRIKALSALARAGDASDPDGHGTHVAGSIVGTGAASNGQNKGMAPGAQLVFQSIMDSTGALTGPDLRTLFTQAWNAGARIHSNSWGAQPDGRYTYSSREVDRFIWENDMAILFAAGNSGDENRDGNPDYNTVSSPSTAKNAIAVGASENNRPDKGAQADNPGQIAGFSSRGNTADGRIKPDIAAPGTWILSAKSALAPDRNFWSSYNQYYGYMGGTSMATPVAAGAVALIRQHYTDRLGINPKPSLLKATLINGAADLGLSTRDQGWGRVDLKNTLQPAAPKEMRFDNESTPLATGQSKEYQYSVESGQTPLKVSLVWTDYPGSTTASKALVNDLDLEVVSPSGQIYRGNDFSQPYNDNTDRLNNVENIKVNNPEVGTYTVRITGYNVPIGPQDYSLVVTGDFANQTPPAEPQPPTQPEPTQPPTQPQPPDQPTNPPVTEPQETAASPVWNGKVASKGTANYYLDVTATGTVTAKLDWAGTADLDMYLYEPSGNLVAKANGTGKPEELTFKAVKQGRYRIRVKSYTGFAEYKLSATHPIDPAKTVVETLRGTLDAADNKTTTHNINVGGLGTINLETGWNNPAADFDIYLYNSSGQQLAKATSGNFNPETISYPVSAPGAYSLKIVAYKGKADYTLKITKPK
ncbi:MAG: S8 family serine peptidase [Clostridia bacterium]|nr:S8 family serine peptidase [Clostridia bacterium]